MTIATIRKTIESCNWSRNDLSGATKSEFKSMDVPSILTKHIEAVQSLVIPARFVRDIENQKWAIECAQKQIQKWTALQA